MEVKRRALINIASHLFSVTSITYHPCGSMARVSGAGARVQATVEVHLLCLRLVTHPTRFHEKSV